jgi:hypothetical protein
MILFVVLSWLSLDSISFIEKNYIEASQILMIQYLLFIEDFLLIIATLFRSSNIVVLMIGVNELFELVKLFCIIVENCPSLIGGDSCSSSAYFSEGGL